MRVAALLIVLGVLSGCLNRYSRIAPVTVPAVNYAVLETPELQLMTFSGVEYDIKVKKIDSLFINGPGRKRVTAAGEWQRGNYRVPADSVEYIIIKKKSGASMMLALVSTAQIMHLMVTRPVGAGQGVSERQEYEPGGSSCPYLYMRDGEGRWRLKAEAFGTAFGKALESGSKYVLGQVKAAGDRFALRLTNERPETHYVNRVGFRLYTVPRGFELAAGADGLFHRYSGTTPLKVYSGSGGDISGLVREEDDLYYRSPKKSWAANAYRDVLEIPLKPGRDRGLLVTARNSYLSSAVMDGLFGFLGDQTLRFYRAIEKDPYWIGRMEEWLDEVALKVYYQNAAGDWQQHGRMVPEATEVDFTRLAPLPDEATAVRLVGMADVWHVNRVVLARDVAPVPAGEPLTYREEYPALAGDDQRYEVMLPGDERRFSLTIPAAEDPAQNRFLTTEIKGYLHEWYTERAQEALLPPLARGNRLAAFGRLIDKRSVFLPLLYKQWRAHPLYLER